MLSFISLLTQAGCAPEEDTQDGQPNDNQTTDVASDSRRYPKDVDGDGYSICGPRLADLLPWGGRLCEGKLADCNDKDAGIYPGALDIPYDGINQDCRRFGTDSGDEVDIDNDGFASVVVEGGTDCNDEDPAISPSATEIAYDGIDQDCNGTDLKDLDGDGFASVMVEGGTDCNDEDATVSPATPETCDGLDNNCNTDIDEGLPTAMYFADVDGDGYGDPLSSIETCLVNPEGHTGNGNDCDDTNPGATTTETYHVDGDYDTYGQDAGEDLCVSEIPLGYSAVSSDCNDHNSAINPDAAEVCDTSNIDEDCNGVADNNDADAIGKTVFNYDGDGDSFGTSATELACDHSAGYTALNSTDCNDGNSALYQNLVGYADTDEDGYSLPTAETICSGDELATGYLAAATTTDCDDGDAEVSPGATENDGNFIDDNCDNTAVISASVANDKLEGYANEQFGYSIAGVGDVTGDGIDDVLIGAPYSSMSGSTESGSAYLTPGSGIEGNPVIATNQTWIDGYDANQATGWAVSSAGDFDGDGNLDFAVGSPANDDYFNNGGLISVFLGPVSPSSSMWSDSAAVLLWGEDDGDNTGTALAGGGDVDGDGYDDILVGARTANSNAGIAYLYSGTSSSTSASLSAATAIVSGDSSNQYVGYDLALADVNADDVEDVIISAPGRNAQTGAAFIYIGPISGSLSTTDADVIYEGASTGDLAGTAIAADSDDGDIDGDGTNDLVVCAQGYNYSSSDNGACYVVYGPHGSATLNSSLGAMIYGANTSDLLGSGDADIGDLDGDGFADILAGGPDIGRGRAFLSYGPLSGSTSIESANIYFTYSSSSSTNEMYGRATAFVGDLDDDGFEDLAIGDNQNVVGSDADAGTAYFLTELQ